MMASAIAAGRSVRTGRSERLGAALCKYYIAGYPWAVTYLRRHVDERLGWALSQLPAVSLEGLRGVGKTTTAQRVAAASLLLDRPVDAMPFEVDPFAAVEGHPEPVLLDEWQLVPEVWDAVRRSVDTRNAPGRFLLSGSSRAAVTAARHTGAARIASIEMRPMTLSERNGTTPDVALVDLIADGTRPLVGHRGRYTPEVQRSTMTRVGLPGLLPLDERAHVAQVESYLTSILASDLQRVDGVDRSATRLRRYLTAYAACVGTTTAHSTIYNAAGLSQATAVEYHDVLTRIGLILELPAHWSNTLKQLAKAPKRHLADAGFAASPIPQAQRDFGRLWENAVVAQIRAVAEATLDRPTFAHLRTASGRQEVDMLVGDAEGRMVAIEAKSAQLVEAKDTRHLRWLRDRDPQVTCGLVVYPGERIIDLGDGIAAVPLAALA